MSGVKTKVNVHSKLTVVSDTPVQPGKTYPLSPLDHAMGLHTLHIIFYYRYDRFDRAGSSDLGRLRESLADVLSSYPPVTGRLKKGDDGNWLVKCNDAGVRVLKAKVNCSLDEWLRSADGSEERNLTVWEEMPEAEDHHIWSPFRIQLNDFEGGGLAIGISCPHMHADPSCATILMKSWTELYRRQCVAHAPFFHPPGLRGRPTPKINVKTDKFYATKSKTSSLQTKPTVKMSTATFKFSETMMKKHLTEIQTKYPNATPFDMLTAMFWLSVTNAKHTFTDQKQESSKISVCIDFRKLLHAPLPHGFFGNALHFSEVSSDVEEMEKGGLEFVTGVVHGHCSSLIEEDYWSAIDWFESQKDEGGKFAEPFQMYGPGLTSANMEHIFAYGAVLEDKKPVHVSYHVGNVEGEGLIMVLPSPEDGLGRTVMVTLPEDQVAMVCGDADILRFEPTLVVSGVTTGSS